MTAIAPCGRRVHAAAARPYDTDRGGQPGMSEATATPAPERHDDEPSPHAPARSLPGHVAAGAAITPAPLPVRWTAGCGGYALTLLRGAVTAREDPD